MGLKPVIKNFIGWLRSKYSRRRWLTSLLFLSISAFIWYLNAMSKDYTADIQFPLQYTALPNDKLIGELPQQSLTITLTAHGPTLLLYRWFPPELKIRLKDNVQAQNHPNYYILTRNLYSNIEEQLDPESSIKRIFPDTLKLMLGNALSKTIPIRSALILSYVMEYLPCEAIRIEPASITVYGPEQILDTLQYIYTENKTITDLQTDLTTTANLLPHPALQYDHSKVTIYQRIERHTEARLSVKITGENVPKGYLMRTFPSTVDINCLVPISQYEEIDANQFIITANYEDLRDGSSSVRLNVRQAPDYASDVILTPTHVNLLLEQE